ncbi:YolD-like family protein [Ureibacillus aquaedulcis]|uniref:YolD-like family protein n=1 Tax=Ureibacillus aquaedulcis TaxID=3058421 RepID=A0ABT8GKU0_9BACL|nr:YolD-like family protein [Ureibacillus sp. BA0131]MDN4492036.1 YolD-like family protein [Ureibacillus sp. BA0131]
MIRDRGNIKWNAMMLPEHVKVLREWHEKDNYVEKPELDEWALQELSEQLQIACNNHTQVEIKIWEAAHIFTATGIISKLDAAKGTLYFEDGRRFPFHFIVGLTKYE